MGRDYYFDVNFYPSPSGLIWTLLVWDAWGHPHPRRDKKTFREAQVDPAHGAHTGPERTQVCLTPFDAIWRAVGSVSPAPIDLHEAHWMNMGADACMFTGT